MNHMCDPYVILQLQPELALREFVVHFQQRHPAVKRETLAHDIGADFNATHAAITLFGSIFEDVYGNRIACIAQLPINMALELNA